MRFEIVSEIGNIELIAAGNSIHVLKRLRKQYGDGRWRKLKGTAPGLITMKKTIRYAVCIDNTDYPASLELHKVYRVLPDEEATADGDLRVIDESGDDYLYPTDYFLPLPASKRIESTLRESFARMGTAV